MNLHIQKLALLNFKNFEDALLEFSPGVNCIVGNNGAGKTNILDAIHYLSVCKSFLNPVDSQNINHEADMFVVQGIFNRDEKDFDIYCGIKKGSKKQFKRDKKAYDKLMDHIGFIPVVVISPLDGQIITEGSDVRRKFIDSVICQVDKEYLAQLLQYNKVLQQRNALLKQFHQPSFSTTTLGLYDEQLDTYGMPVYEKRLAFFKEFNPILEKYFNQIAHANEKVEIEYVTQMKDGSLLDLLTKNRRKDLSNFYTNYGVHKDDLLLNLNGHPIKKFGSQGQQKTLLIALKLAKLEYLKEKLNIHPILLLDDAYDKLDDNRMQYLLKLLTDEKLSQIFITDTSKERIPSIFKQLKVDVKVFEISGGKVA